MDPLQAQECFVFLPVTQARSSAAANEQKWGCCAQTPVPPSSPRKRHGARPRRGSGPAHKPPAAAPRSLPTTEHSQDSLPSFLPSQRGRRGGSRAARAPAEQSPPRGWMLCQPHHRHRRGSEEVQQRGNAETQRTQRPHTALRTDRLMGRLSARRRGSHEQCCRPRQEKGKSAPRFFACASVTRP